MPVCTPPFLTELMVLEESGHLVLQLEQGDSVTELWLGYIVEGFGTKVDVREKAILGE